jgi:hypothetical protein
MKRLSILFSFILLFSYSAEAQILNKAKSLLSKKGAFSKEEAADALKEAFVQGTGKGVDILSELNGYYGNPKVKIPIPTDAKNVEDKLRALGLGNEVDQAIESLNRAAEDAAVEAKGIFITAIKGLSITDALNIVSGQQDAGTRFLESQTTNDLTNKFSPIISASLKKVDATKYWSHIMGKYNKIPFVKKVETDLTAYVTQKAIDGLFVMIAQEELNIRQNPAARTSALLAKVFK